MEWRKLTSNLIYILKNKLSYLAYRLEIIENKIDKELQKIPVNKEKYFNLLKTFYSLEKKADKTSMKIAELYKKLNTTN